MAQDPTGAVVRNLIILQRLGNGVAAEVRALLRELFDELAAELVKIDPTGVEADRYKRQRIQALLDRVDELSVEHYEVIRRAVRQRVAEIGAQQARWALDHLHHTIGGLDVRLRPGEFGLNLAKAILDRDPIHGELLADAFSEMGHRVSVAFRREVQLGMAQEEALQQIVARVREDLQDVTRRGAESYVRTAINDIANTAHLETWEANRDVLDGIKFTCALDEATCPQCRALDGTVWEFGDENIKRPPLHHQDRCVLLPVVAWKRLGIKPPAEGTRASADGPVKSSTTYERWLKDQSASEQDEILGPTRARLFRANKVTLRDLVKGDGRVISVSDL